MLKDPKGMACKFVIAKAGPALRHPVCPSCGPLLCCPSFVLPTMWSCLACMLLRRSRRGQKPAGAQVTERAVPVAIFSAEPATRLYHLRKWLQDKALASVDVRDIVD